MGSAASLQGLDEETARAQLACLMAAATEGSEGEGGGDGGGPGGARSFVPFDPLAFQRLREETENDNGANSVTKAVDLYIAAMTLPSKPTMVVHGERLAWQHEDGDQLTSVPLEDTPCPLSCSANVGPDDVCAHRCVELTSAGSILTFEGDPGRRMLANPAFTIVLWFKPCEQQNLSASTALLTMENGMPLLSIKPLSARSSAVVALGKPVGISGPESSIDHATPATTTLFANEWCMLCIATIATTPQRQSTKPHDPTVEIDIAVGRKSANEKEVQVLGSVVAKWEDLASLKEIGSREDGVGTLSLCAMWCGNALSHQELNAMYMRGAPNHGIDIDPKPKPNLNRFHQLLRRIGHEVENESDDLAPSATWDGVANLAGTELQEHELNEMIAILGRCLVVKVLDISCNPSLTAASLDDLLEFMEDGPPVSLTKICLQGLDCSEPKEHGEEDEGHETFEEALLRASEALRMGRGVIIDASGCKGLSPETQRRLLNAQGTEAAKKLADAVEESTRQENEYMRLQSQIDQMWSNAALCIPPPVIHADSMPPMVPAVLAQRHTEGTALDLRLEEALQLFWSKPSGRKKRKKRKGNGPQESSPWKDKAVFDSLTIPAVSVERLHLMLDSDGAEPPPLKVEKEASPEEPSPPAAVEDFFTSRQEAYTSAAQAQGSKALEPNVVKLLLWHQLYQFNQFLLRQKQRADTERLEGMHHALAQRYITSKLGEFDENKSDEDNPTQKELATWLFESPEPPEEMVQFINDQFHTIGIRETVTDGWGNALTFPDAQLVHAQAKAEVFDRAHAVKMRRMKASQARLKVCATKTTDCESLDAKVLDELWQQRRGSGMLVAHFSFLAGADNYLIDPGHFGFTARAPAKGRRTKPGVLELHDAVDKGLVHIEAAVAYSFGHRALGLTLRCGPQAVTVKLMRGTVFQHTGWVHKQNLVLSLTTKVSLASGEAKSVRLAALCMNLTCRCNHGEPLELTNWMLLRPEVKLQSQLWEWLEGQIDLAAKAGSKTGKTGIALKKAAEYPEWDLSNEELESALVDRRTCGGA